MPIAHVLVRSVFVIRLRLLSIVMLALLAGACASGEDPTPSPTAPTPTPPPATTPPPPPPSNSCLPGAASNLSSSLNNSTRTITWTAGANATSYDLQIGITSGGSEVVRESGIGSTHYAWTGGGSSTSNTFYARVHSHNSCGSGPSSAELVFH
jgi:hypothetical protein